VWLCFEIVFIYFVFPETYGKTLEELHFLFESEKDERDQLAAAASKAINDSTVIELHEHPDKKA
jgi:hypothetical protein